MQPPSERPQRPNWAQHAESLARAAAQRSEDPYCKVGAAVLDKHHLVRGVGYNGTVAGADVDFLDRNGRRPYVIHAESNALRVCDPVAVAGGLLAVTHFPCSACVLQTAAYGIQEIAWVDAPDWSRYPRDLTERIAVKVGVRLVRIERWEWQ